MTLETCSQESLSEAYGRVAGMDARRVAGSCGQRAWRRRAEALGCAQVLAPAELRAVASFTGERLMILSEPD